MKTFKSAVIACLIFALGMLAGGLLTGKMIELRVRNTVMGGPPALAELIVKRLGSSLKLDKPQRAQLLSIVQESQKKGLVIRRQVEPQIEEILAEAEVKVRAILKPDQQKKFEDLVASRHADWEKIKAAGRKTE